jgi:hypothetical protein
VSNQERQECYTHGRQATDLYQVATATASRCTDRVLKDGWPSIHLLSKINTQKTIAAEKHMQPSVALWYYQRE